MNKIFFGIYFLCFICANGVHAEFLNMATSNKSFSMSGECVRSCLILALGDIFQNHTIEENVEEIKLLMHYSFKNCPGLFSAFKIFGRFLEIKRMTFFQTLEWIETDYGCNGTIHKSTTLGGFPWEKTSTFRPIFRSSTPFPSRSK